MFQLKRRMLESRGLGEECGKLSRSSAWTRHDMSEAPCHAVGFWIEHNKASAASTMQILRRLVFEAHVDSIAMFTAIEGSF
jgi:hypothetical protein